MLHWELKQASLGSILGKYGCVKRSFKPTLDQSISWLEAQAHMMECMVTHLHESLQRHTSSLRERFCVMAQPFGYILL